MAIIFGFQLLVPQPERTPITEEQTNSESLVDLSIQKSSTTVLAERNEVINETGRVNFDNSKIICNFVFDCIYIYLGGRVG